MIWMTWRQFRSGAIAAGAALIALAVALIATRPGLVSLYDGAGLTGCHAGCATDAARFINSVKSGSSEKIFYAGVGVMYLTPALIGLFWGAPLIARELDSGTFRLAWSQSVTRARWIAVKLMLTGGAAMLTVGLISLMINWWSGPLYAAAARAGLNILSISRITPVLFGASGIVSLGYAAFAFALGSAVGVLLRRTLPAMAVTLVVFTAIQVLVPFAIRPHLIPPLQTAQPLSTVQVGGTGVSANDQLFLQVNGINGRPGDWIIGARPVGATGQPATRVPSDCASLGTNFLQCLAHHGVKMEISYQPASRYWELQTIETAIAVGLGGLCYWGTRVRESAA